MTTSPRTLANTAEPAHGASEVPPYRNPAYPPRVHFGERAKLEERLRSCDQRLESAFQKLNALGSNPKKADFVRLYHQMQGARDQIADAARRMPLEVGGLYHEDHERFEQAVAAFERTVGRWEKAGA